MEGKLLSNLMRRVPKAPSKENQTNQQRNQSEAERKVLVQFTKHVEVLTSLKRSKQSKQQPSNSITASRGELQSTTQRYKTFQDLVEEVNTKTGIGYKLIEDSDQPNKLKVLYQQTVHLLEEEIPKQQVNYLLCIYKILFESKEKSIIPKHEGKSILVVNKRSVSISARRLNY